MGGGGTPEVVAYLNCINMPKVPRAAQVAANSALSSHRNSLQVVRLKTLIGKIVGTILSVSANMAMGPEGSCHSFLLFPFSFLTTLYIN
jgi:hypothetical protein